MTDKELEIIKKLNKIQSSIEPIEKNFKTIQNIQKSMYRFNKITPLSEIQKNVDKWNKYLKPIHEMDIGLLPIIEKHSRYYQSPLSEIIKKQVELRNRIEQNLFFNSIWRGTPIENTLENQERIESEAKEFASDILELTSHISDQEIEKSIPVDEILEEINEVSEIPIDKNSLSTAISFMYASSYSKDNNISNKAKTILAGLGKFSESPEGKGLAFLMVVMTFLKALLS